MAIVVSLFRVGTKSEGFRMVPLLLYLIPRFRERRTNKNIFSTRVYRSALLSATRLVCRRLKDNKAPGGLL